MRFATLTVFVVIVMVATSAVGFCQTARSMGMGMTGVGLADDAAAWGFNPAGLPHMDVAKDNDEWAKGIFKGMEDVDWQAIVGADFGGDVDQDVFHFGGVVDKHGFAIGRIHSDPADTTLLGIGYGTTLGKLWSFGGSVVNAEAGALHETVIDLGLMYQWHPALGKGKPAKIGFLAVDVTDELQDVYNAGLSFWIGPNVLIAADVLDIGDDTKVAGVPKTGTQFNVGGEWLATDWLALRIGAQDGDFGGGIGINYKGWKLEAGMISFDFGVGPDVDAQLFCLSKDW